MLKKRWIATLVALLLLVASWLAGVQLALAAEGEFSIGSGISYSSGDYGGSAATQPGSGRETRGARPLAGLCEHLGELLCRHAPRRGSLAGAQAGAGQAAARLALIRRSP